MKRFAGNSLENRKERTMETESKNTMRYFNAAYVKRSYGKWMDLRLQIEC